MYREKQNYMASLKDIINLLEQEKGKAFIMDESGEVKLVILGIEEYETTLVNRLQKVTQDIEAINDEIIKAQLEGEPRPVPPEVKPPVQKEKVIERPTRVHIPPPVPVVIKEETFEEPKVIQEDIPKFQEHIELKPQAASFLPEHPADPMHIRSALEERFRQWPGKFTVPKVQTQIPNMNNSREEAIDPTFDFESPKINLDDLDE